MRHTVRRLVLLLATLFGGALLAAAPAAAHATLVSSNPADGARLQSAPSTVRITFDENVGLGGVGFLHVTNQQGKRVESDKAYHPNHDNSAIAVDLQQGLADGTYTESFRIISADSHPVAGIVRFVVGNGPLVQSSVPGATGTVNHGTSVALEVSRWISWAGLALFGGSWLLLTVWQDGRDDRRAKAIVWTGWGGAVLGGALELLIQGPYSAGFGLSRIADWTVLDDTLHGKYGEWHSVRLLILGVLAVLFAWTLQPGRERYLEAAAPLGLALAYTYSASGHAETTNPTWLSLLFDTLHLAAMAIWIGGLVIVVGALLPRRDPDELDAVLPAFSRTAFAAVVVLAVTGTYAAYRGVGSLRALTHTEYGLLILAKIVLFVGLIALGNFSRRAVQRRVVVAYAMSDDVEAVGAIDEIDEDELRAEKLRRSVLVELALAVLVLAATAVLVGQPRGAEALAAQAREPITKSTALGSGSSATVTVNPGVHGNVSVDVSISAATPPTSVTGTATEKAKQLGPIPLQLTKENGELWTAGSVDLPVAGDWEIDLVVTSSKFDAVTADVVVSIH